MDDGYKVSNYGRILSLAKTTIRGRKYDKILSASKKDNGYYIEYSSDSRIIKNIF